MRKKEPILQFFRDMKIRKEASKIPTSILPLREIHVVTVLLDWSAPDAGITDAAVRNFFSKRGVDVFVINPGSRDFTPLGRLRNRARLQEGKFIRHEDLFISLASGSSFAEEYEAAVSPAKFKIGRCQTNYNSYDFVLSDNEFKHYPQSEVFEAIVSELLKIS